MRAVPLVIRRDVAASTATWLGTWPVVALDLTTRFRVSEATSESGGSRLKASTGKYGRSASRRASRGRIGQ